MKVICTLDYLDGAESRSKTVDIDRVDTTFLLLTLMNPGVASITITRADLLKGLGAFKPKGD